MIHPVEASADGGKTWSQAKLGPDLGRFSFREWSFEAQAKQRGKLEIVARATNAVGQTHVARAIFNPAGYHHNVMPRITLDVA